MIAEVLAGRSALAVLPTGGGKSLCYQIPSLVLRRTRPGGLAADRADGGPGRGAAAVRRGRRPPGQLHRSRRARRHLAPDRRRSARPALPVARRADAGRRCWSASATGSWRWSPSTRPIASASGATTSGPSTAPWADWPRSSAHVPRLAVTATADARTRADIRSQLRIEDAREFVDSFARPELRLAAERKQGAAKRVLQLVAERPGRAGVIYTGSRDGAERLAASLVDRGRSGARLPRRPRQDGARPPASPFLDEDGGSDGGDHRLRHGRRQARRPLRHPRRPAGLHRSLLAGGRARGPRRRAGRRHHALWRLRSRVGAAPHRQPRDRRRGRRRCRCARCASSTPCSTAWAAAPPRCAATSARADVRPCGQCDLCLAPPAAEDATQSAQKALSAVHRLGGRFGRGRIVDHLLGKTKEPSGFEAALSTFGVGQERDAAGLARTDRPAAVRGPAA